MMILEKEKFKSNYYKSNKIFYENNKWKKDLNL